MGPNSSLLTNLACLCLSPLLEEHIQGMNVCSMMPHVCITLTRLTVYQILCDWSHSQMSLPAIYGEGSVDIQAAWTDGHLTTDYTGTQRLFCPDIKVIQF